MNNNLVSILVSIIVLIFFCPVYFMILKIYLLSDIVIFEYYDSIMDLIRLWVQLESISGKLSMVLLFYIRMYSGVLRYDLQF